MNVQKMEELAAYIEALPKEQFDMDTWVSFGKDLGPSHICEEQAKSCGTACCIAGWQVLKEGFCLDSGGRVLGFVGGRFTYTGQSARMFAQNTLGLDFVQQDSLFFARDWPLEFTEGVITPQVAASRIRHMIRTGK